MLSCVLAVRFCFFSMKPEVVIDNVNKNGAKLDPVYYVHPLVGGHIIFAFSAIRRPTWFPDVLGNSSYPIFTKFGMQVYWVNSLCGIAFGDDSCIAN